MVQIRLPENSKVQKGNYYKDKTGYSNIKKVTYKRLYLHSFRLIFKHPKSNKIITIKDAPPKSFTDMLDKSNLQNINYE